MNNRGRVDELLSRKKDLRNQMRNVDDELTNIVTSFEGPLEEAIAIGLVKPAFALPAAFYHYLRNKY